MEDKEKYDLLKDGTHLTPERTEEIIKEFDDAMKNGTARLGSGNPFHRKTPKEPLRISYYRLPKYIQNELKLTD